MSLTLLGILPIALLAGRRLSTKLAIPFARRLVTTAVIVWVAPGP
jgi:hypothetical protein